MINGATNKYDNYDYFSEEQYKELFTELFSEHGLELKFTEIEHEMFDGTEKQGNGRKVKLEFYLFDIETGFYETTAVSGEGIDKGDKAVYKAYTGALKYYLADTFIVPTKDDPEKESQSVKMTNRDKSQSYVPAYKDYGAPEQKQADVERKASAAQVAVLAKAYTGDNLDKLLIANGVEKIEDLSMKKASDIITKLTQRGKK